MTDESLKTVTEIAAYLQMSEDAVREMARAGKIPAIRMAKEWRFEMQSVRNWLLAKQSAQQTRGNQS